MSLGNHVADPATAFRRTPRWAVLAAYAVPLCILPSAIWRTHGALSGADPTDTSTWYPILLSALSMGLGLLTLGLAHSWGEAVPRWIPAIGGRRVPTLAAVIPATLGAIALRRRRTTAGR